MGKVVRALRRSNFAAAEPYHKYLKPGALARIRDSRISARSPSRVHRDSSRQASPSSGGSDSDAYVVDSVPFFVPRAYGPRFPQRKKLLGTKSLGTHSLSPAALSPASPSDSVANDFGSDI